MFCNSSAVWKIKDNRQWNFTYIGMLVEQCRKVQQQHSIKISALRASQSLQKNVPCKTIWLGSKLWTVCKNYTWLTRGAGLFCIFRFPHIMLLHARQYQVLLIWNRQSTKDAVFWTVMPSTLVDMCWCFTGSYHNGPSRLLGMLVCSNLSTLWHDRSLLGHHYLNFKIHRQSTV
jgi:hypothetical protein